MSSPGYDRVECIFLFCGGFFVVVVNQLRILVVVRWMTVFDLNSVFFCPDDPRLNVAFLVFRVVWPCS